MNSNRIALIHATPVAMSPVAAAFQEIWPSAELVNLLDDSLSADRALSEKLSPELSERIQELARYAESIGSDGILFTCSAFGAAIERAAKGSEKTILKPNEAMFEDALTYGSRVAMVYTFEPARAGMEQEFYAQASRHPFAATLTSHFVAGAMDALRQGNEDQHNRLVADTIASLAPTDVVLLAHFSTSLALHAARAATAVPVLSSPDAAVRKLQRVLTRT